MGPNGAPQTWKLNRCYRLIVTPNLWSEALCFCSGGGAQPRRWASERGSTSGERSCITTWLASDLELMDWCLGKRYVLPPGLTQLALWTLDCGRWGWILRTWFPSTLTLTESSKDDEDGLIEVLTWVSQSEPLGSSFKLSMNEIHSKVKDLLILLVLLSLKWRSHHLNRFVRPFIKLISTREFETSSRERYVVWILQIWISIE